MKIDFIVFFIHPELRISSHPDYRKARLATSAFLLFFAFFIPYAIYFFIKYPDDDIKLLTNFIGIPFFTVLFIVLRFSKQLNNLLGVLNICSLGLIFVSIYNTGGIYSADIAWLILAVLTAFVVIGNHWGWTSLSAALFGIITMYNLEQYDVHKNLFKNYIIQHDSTHYVFTWVFVIILLGVLLYSVNKIIEKINLRIKELHDNNIHELEFRLKQKTEEISQLRSNLAKDFHDEMGNKLASINILSQSIALQLKNRQPDLLESLEAIEKRAKELYQGTRDFIWSVDVRSDNVYELFRHTRDFGERFFLPLGLSFVAKTTLPENIPRRLNPTTTRQYLYIMKEVFTNAAKHSKCTEINLFFELLPNTLEITMQDNGIGMQNQNIEERGLKNIKERIKEIGGRMKLTSSSNGTVYHFSIPLEVEPLPEKGGCPYYLNS